jgi:iron complex outermembrane recepter protein
MAADTSLSVQAQPIVDALQDLAQQAGFRLFLTPADLPPTNSVSIEGEHDVKRALEKMLVRTGIHCKVDYSTRTISGCSKSSPLASPSTQKLDTAPTQDIPSELAQVIVTGTLIHGGQLIADYVSTIRTQEIDAYSGSPADLLNSLPLVFGGGATELINSPSAESTTNTGLGAGVNLRGLGDGATLVLLDGHRLAPSGSYGEFTDVLSIPLAPMDRIEILTGGASALYGTDAVAGVVNFISRDGASGTQTSVQEGGVTRGSLMQSRISQSFGGVWSSGNGTLTFERSAQTELPAYDRGFESSNQQPHGGENLNSPLASPPNIQIGSVTYAFPQLHPYTLNLQDLYFDSNLLPRREQTAVLGKGFQELGSLCSIAPEGLFSHRQTTQQLSPAGASFLLPSTSPYYLNPTGGGASETVDDSLAPELGPQITLAIVDVSQFATDLRCRLTENLNITLSVDHATDSEHQDNWGLLNLTALETAAASSDPRVAFDPFPGGPPTPKATIAAIDAQPQFASRSQINDLSVKVDGRLLTLPGGSMLGALGEEFRNETLATRYTQDTGLPESDSHYRRWLLTTFAQLEVPLFGGNYTYPGLRELTLISALHTERNSDFGHTEAPLLRLQYSPASVVRLTGSWNLSYEAPPLPDLDASKNATLIATMADPSSPSGFSNVLIASGNNRGLSEERGNTKSAGVNFSRPAQNDDSAIKASLDITYYNIQFTGRIEDELFSPTALSDPAYTSVVIRNPSLALRTEICTAGQFVGTLSACETQPIAAILDLRLHNIDNLLTQGIDLHSSVTTPRYRWGTLTWDITGTEILGYSERQSPAVPPVSSLNTLDNPLRLRVRSSLGYKQRGWGAVLTINFQNHYRDTLTSPITEISSWTTLDLTARYRFSQDSAFVLRNLEFGITFVNLANHAPPFAENLLNDTGWDFANANPFNRMVMAHLRKKW